jgi:hypothetical protein
MACNRKADLARAERARAALNQPSVPPEPRPEQAELIVVDSSDDEEVNNHSSPHPASPSHEIETPLRDELLESLCLRDEHNSRESRLQKVQACV